MRVLLVDARGGGQRTVGLNEDATARETRLLLDTCGPHTTHVLVKPVGSNQVHCERTRATKLRFIHTIQAVATIVAEAAVTLATTRTPRHTGHRCSSRPRHRQRGHTALLMIAQGP